MSKHTPASLIAAAPELLAEVKRLRQVALSLCMQLVVNGIAPSPDGVPTLINKTDALIAKAERGEE